MGSVKGDCLTCAFGPNGLKSCVGYQELLKHIHSSDIVVENCVDTEKCEEFFARNPGARVLA